MPPKPHTQRPRAAKRPAKKPAAPSPSPAPAPAATGRGRGFPIVGIGASAGGLEALEELFARIILSGTASDGTLGLKAIKGAAGLATVQQVQSAKYAGMPSSAAATGLADFVLPPPEMPRQLVAYARGPYLATPPDAICLLGKYPVA